MIVQVFTGSVLTQNIKKMRRNDGDDPFHLSQAMAECHCFLSIKKYYLHYYGFSEKIICLLSTIYLKRNMWYKWSANKLYSHIKLPDYPSFTFRILSHFDNLQLGFGNPLSQTYEIDLFPQQLVRVYPHLSGHNLTNSWKIWNGASPFFSHFFDILGQNRPCEQSYTIISREKCQKLEEKWHSAISQKKRNGASLQVRTNPLNA